MLLFKKFHFKSLVQTLSVMWKYMLTPAPSLYLNISCVYVVPLYKTNIVFIAPFVFYICVCVIVCYFKILFFLINTSLLKKLITYYRIWNENRVVVIWGKILHIYLYHIESTIKIMYNNISILLNYSFIRNLFHYFQNTLQFHLLFVYIQTESSKK